jgi:hypothetical protein
LSSCFLCRWGQIQIRDNDAVRLLLRHLPGFIEQAILDEFAFGLLIVIFIVKIRILRPLECVVALSNQSLEALIGVRSICHGPIESYGLFHWMLMG